MPVEVRLVRGRGRGLFVTEAVEEGAAIIREPAVLGTYGDGSALERWVRAFAATSVAHKEES